MKKIPLIFKLSHDPEGSRTITKELREDFLELISNEGSSLKITRKRDGTAIKLTEDGNWLARRKVSKGKKAPENFILEELDPNTGHSFGWVPMEESSFKKIFNEAIKKASLEGKTFSPGTFELASPKINGNPENLESPEIFSHGTEEISDFPDLKELLTANPSINLLEELKPYFEHFKNKGIEGIVIWAGEAGSPESFKPRFKLRAKDFFPELDKRH